MSIWIVAIWPLKLDEDTRYYGPWETEAPAAEFLYSECTSYGREGETILVEPPVPGVSGPANPLLDALERWRR